MSSLPSRASVLLAFLLAFAAAPLTHAAGTAARGPITFAADENEVVTEKSGIIDLNAARTPVNTTFGYDATTHIRVDADNGIVKGFARFDLAKDTTVPLDAEVGAMVLGSLTTPVTFDGSITTPETVMAELRFDGSFNALQGLPTFSLFGNITASTFTAIPFSQSLYQSQVAFVMAKPTLAYSPQAVFTSTETQTTGSGSTRTPFYAGASHVIVSEAPDSLQAIVRLSFDVVPGQSYLISSNVSGLVSAEPGENMTANDAEIRASSGIVDFFNTAELSLYVPDTLSVSGGDPLLENIVIATAVPEPQIATMMLAGLLGIGFMARRRARG